MPLIEHMWRMSAVSISTRYVLIASMDVTPEAESLFNEIYDTEHVPNLLQVPGVHSVTRMKGEPARFAIAGSRARVTHAQSGLHGDLRDRRSAGVGKHAMGGSRRTRAVAERSAPAPPHPAHFVFKVQYAGWAYGTGTSRARGELLTASPPLLTLNGHCLTDP